MKNRVTMVILLCYIFSTGLVSAQGQTDSAESKIHYVDQVATLDELFGKFRGQVIYVDYWGSWCASCLEEFVPNTELDAFIRKNNIVRLYIALEKEAQEPKRELASFRFPATRSSTPTESL
jgi:thiol-disulfide isomerase/thioredoxin